MVSIDSIDTWSEITMTEVQFQLYHGGQALLVGTPLLTLIYPIRNMKIWNFLS
jgi:hypothetical protein